MAMIKGLPATEPSKDGIQAALGLSGYTDYAVLIRPDLYGPKKDIVKFWAKFQPMHSTQLHKLTDDYRRKNGYGIKDNYNYEYNDTTDVNEAFNRAVNGNYSLYREKPTGGIDTSPFRPWDYYSEDGTMAYNNEAVPPFSFKVEEITNRGYVQVSVFAHKDEELPVANITLTDLQAVGGLNSIISNDGNTCFGLLYTKDGGQVQVIGGNGEYPAILEGNQGERTVDIKLVGDGTYKFVFIVLNKQTKRFITIPSYSAYEVTVTSTDIPSGLLLIEGLYHYNTAGTIMTITDLTLTPQNAPAVAGNLAIYICPIGTKEEKVESEAIYTTSKSYGDIAQGSSYTFPDFTINVSDYDINNIEVWVTTTTSSGVYKRQLEWYDNSGDIE